MLTSKYPCTQAELYTISKLAWKSVKQHLADFSDFKAKYDLAFIAARTAEIDAAENLPDDQARSSIAEMYRIQMSESAEKCLNAWQKLKRYIIEAYPEALHKPQLEAAGSEIYVKASQNNWDSVRALTVSASNFINNNSSALSANQNMPASFQTQFDTLKSDFEMQHQLFLDSQETATQQTHEKITANNEVYAQLIKMCLDGQEIFRKDESLKRQFIISDLLYLASGAGTAGVKGYITDTQTGLPLDAVIVSIYGSTKTTTTDTDGKYELLQMAKGFYTLKFEKTGYITQEITNFEIKIGTVSQKDIQISPI
jgi:hypothetical protein